MTYFRFFQGEDYYRHQINVVVNELKLLHWAESFVENGENAGYQHFLFFPQFFQKPFFPGREIQGLFGKG